MAIEPSKSIPKQTGDFIPYIYGNPKVHKSIQDPKLKPIISQVSNPKYNLSKYLKKIVSPYMPHKYALASTYEFLDLIRASESSRAVVPNVYFPLAPLKKFCSDLAPHTFFLFKKKICVIILNLIKI